MPRKQFEANVRHRPGGVAMIDLNGEIDGFAKETLTTAYDEAEKGDPEVVLLDFGGVGYINSAGIALIVDLLARARASKRSIVACGLSEHYVEVFEITRLSDFMAVFEDEESAMENRHQATGVGHQQDLKPDAYYLTTKEEQMPQAQVTMDVRKASDEVSVVDVRGELTGFAEGVLMEAYSQASEGGTRAIVLNFEGLEYMNSSGIGLLVTLLIRVNRERRKLLTCGLSEHYRNIFQITRLDDAIATYDSEEEAVRAAKAP